jgi:AraC-like DNA-binding protein
MSRHGGPDGSSGRLVLARAPGPVLQPFVESLWAIDPRCDRALGARRREHVLPTGQMHLAFRLGREPLRLFSNDADEAGRSIGDAVVGGARDVHYIRDVSRPASSVGAQLLPGAAEALFGVHADELAGRHTPLDDLWGGEVDWMREQLMEPAMLHQRIDRLESILIARLSTRRTIHPVVPRTLEQLRATSSIRRIVQNSGYSHRSVMSLFRRSVGLTPKRYWRVLRFQRVLGMVFGPGGVSLADAALEAGYADQAHFSREFKAFTGVTPSEYRRASPEHPHHLRIDAGRR